MSGSTRIGEIVKLAGGFMMERATNIDNFYLKCFIINIYLYFCFINLIDYFKSKIGPIDLSYKVKASLLGVVFFIVCKFQIYIDKKNITNLIFYYILKGFLVL